MLDSFPSTIVAVGVFGASSGLPLIFEFGVSVESVGLLLVVVGELLVRVHEGDLLKIDGLVLGAREGVDV